MRRFVVGALLTLLASPVHAKPTAETVDRHAVNGWQQTQVALVKTQRSKAKRHKQKWDAPAKASRYVSKRHQGTKPIGRTVAATILPHPPGCPSRAFCGCGAALDVFGKHVRDLWLARNWYRFPRTAAAPGMVAVRRHHVFVIRRVIAPGVVLAYDANSGRHLTRLHVRRLAGYVVVNPHRGVVGVAASQTS